ncbi:MAG: smc 1, partial [Sporomusa sp.]|nr:smc 1 [Sporomusa sp.]
MLQAFLYYLYYQTPRGKILIDLNTQVRVIVMLLRRLEAYGFKSFAEKTELEFGQGITAIVGPNGSGKSNISDAIRWALGEQSIRTLRGAKMEDVIFSGSAIRRQLGVAEVSLVFDNSDGLLPLDFNEVTITRRVFRSGDSEYYINKVACRLKDIHDMLADTGLGRESMTVIGQNKIDEILSSKPEERRLLFEEAAGISKYKQRKRDAMRKLDDTEQNLTRVHDITSELESQLEPLKESAARTTSFNKLSAELVACQATVLIERLEKAEKMVESA